jgi:Phosphodiester glycosidase
MAVSVDVAMLTKNALDASAPSDAVIDGSDLVGAPRTHRGQRSGRAAPCRSGRLRARRRRVRRRRVVASIVVALLLIPVWSFAHAVLVSNGDPFSANATEWARGHSLGWLVDDVEHWWYSHHQPPTGGAPKGGIARVAPRVVGPAAVHSSAAAVAASVCPSNIPPFATTRLAGEGVWQTAGRSRGAVCFAYLRPDAMHTSVLVGAAWMNMSVLTATLHNGTSVPGGGPWRAGSTIAPSDYGRVVAAFNGGFRLDASNGGYFTEGRVAQPLVVGRASLVILADGRVDVGVWARDDQLGANVVSVRQNLDLIVDHSQLVAGLSDANSRQWGATLGNLIYTWRSGVGVDAHHNLVYVAGPGLNVETLAAVLQHAGCVRAMELDINPEWVSLMTYRGSSPSTIAATKLLSNMQRPADRYLHANTRDFIELDTRR